MDEPEPAGSLYDTGKVLNVGESENLEEEEDIIEQIKRREELQNLLTNVLEDFKYEDSTINSSTNVSVVSTDCIEKAYGDTQTPYEQLKFLYDIRMKEIQALNNEFDDYKKKSIDEVGSLKKRLILQEAETSQAEISLKNTKSLLVENVNKIAEQENILSLKNEELDSLKKVIEQLQYDVQAYNLTIEELQLKLTMDTGAFNVAARVFNSEELQTKHREQVEKLESLLEEQRRKNEILQKEKEEIDTNFKKLIETTRENELYYNNTLTLLSANVDSAQNQCKDLLNLVEMLTKENEHFKARVQKLEADEPILLSNSFKRKSLDYNTLINHNERLKKMLLDKEVELSTLKSKVKFYEADVKELIQLRNIKNHCVLKRECNQPEHFEKITFIQNELKILQRELVEKNHEISDLSSINRELEDKIENMIMQTRIEIEKLSHKYKLPELETMNEELQNAEVKIKDLQQKLDLSEAETQELKSKFNKNHTNELKLQLADEAKKVLALEEVLKNNNTLSEKESELKEENNKLKKKLDDLSIQLTQMEYYKKIKEDFESLNHEYKQVADELREKDKNKYDESETKDLFKLRADVRSFLNVYKTKPIEKELLEIKLASWLDQINFVYILFKNIKDSEVLSKNKLVTLKRDIKDYEQEIKNLTKIIDDQEKTKILTKDENSDLECDLKELRKLLNHKNVEINDLRKELDIMKDGNKGTIQTLEDASKRLGEAKTELIQYQEELLKKSEIIKNYESEIKKRDLEIKTSKDNYEHTQKELEMVRKHVEELIENQEQKVTNEDGDKCTITNEDLFKAKLLKAEVTIQEELRNEYERKVAKIEGTYRNIFEANKQKLNKFKEQESNYRHELADLLSKYAEIISPIQKENDELKEYITKLEIRYAEFKKYVDTSKKEYSIQVEKNRRDAQEAIDSWKMWAKAFVQGCLSIEKLNAQSRNNILNSLKEFDSQVNSVDKYFEEKIRQYKKKHNVINTRHASIG